MDVEELKGRLETAQETQTFDIKAATPWSVKAYAKDILAFANVRDGGVILVGVDDATFNRTGVSETDRSTYKIDTMRDQMTKFADPHVDFHVTFPRDREGRQYVAIEVAPFRETPVICRLDNPEAGTKAGVLYYRNTNRRAESAPVSNSYDMRDIVTVAAVRARGRLVALGVLGPPEDDLARQLDAEVAGL